MANDDDPGQLTDLRDTLTGAVLRKAMNLRDAGGAVMAFLRDVTGRGMTNTDGDKDVNVGYESVIDGARAVAKLFIPMNMLWNAPAEGLTAMIVRGAETGGAAAYALFGDAGAAIPSWFAEKAGLWIDKVLRLESSNNAVEIQAADPHDVTVNGGILKVARVTDGVNCCSLSATSAGGVVTFTLVPLDANGFPAGPPIVGPSVTISGVIANNGGAQHFKA